MSTQPFNAQNQPLTFAARAAILTKFGIPAMPLEPRSKKAFLPNWQGLATTDSAQIARWDEQNPEYNCAAVGRTGGFWIFEIDNSALFTRIEKETGHSLDELDTLVVKSSGEKRHYYFKHDARSEAMGNISADDKNGEVFSVRAHNAYVVSAGSIHPKTEQPYVIVLEPTWGEIPTAPAWLMDWLLTFSKPSGTAKTEKIPEIIPLHSRNKTLTSLAGTMRRRGMSEDEIFAGLQKPNQNRCVPPLTDEELGGIAKSVAKYAPAKDAISTPTEAQQDETADDAEDPGLFQYAQKPSELSDQPVDWVLDGMFPRKSLSIVCGREGIGKGVNALLSVAALLNGGSFLGHKAYFVPHILYVDLENPEAVVRDRLAKLGLLDAKNLLIWGQWNPVPPPTQFDDPLYMEYAKKIGGFIFFDSLIDFCNGADENNAAEMNEALTKARLLARHCAGVHIQHHSDKYGKSGWRGTTAITAAVDMAFGIRADDEDAFRKGTNREVCFSTLKPKMCAPYHINYEVVGWNGQLAYQLVPERKPVAAADDLTPKIKKPTKIEAALALSHEFILDKLHHQKPVTVGDVKDRLAQEAYVRDVIREVVTILRAKFETKKGKGKDQTVWFLREKEIEKAPESEGENGLF